MKKELFAAITLLSLLIASVSNLIHLDSLTAQITKHINYCKQYCFLEDYESAHKELNKALTVWNSADNYTHIFIRHSEVDTMSDVLYDTLCAIDSKEKEEAENLLNKLQYHTDSIIGMEQLSLRSVF